MDFDQLWKESSELGSLISHSKQAYRKPLVVESFLDIVDDFDVFWLDKTGTLELNKLVLSGVHDFLEHLKAKNKHIVVVANGSNSDLERVSENLNALGINLANKDIVTSISPLKEVLAQHSSIRTWGILGSQIASSLSKDLSVVDIYKSPSELDTSRGFVICATDGWTPQIEFHLFDDLKKHKDKPVIVTNCDIGVPINGSINCEPGHYALKIKRDLGINPIFTGKPAIHIFQHAHKLSPSIPKNRILMIGDNLHTDMLGANSFGVATCLVTTGIYRGKDPLELSNKSQIWPTYILQGGFS